MAEDSGISWTHHTLNFWLGCDKVDPGCAHCYIDRTLIRLGRKPWGEIQPTGTRWADPWKWEQEAALTRKSRRVFTCSLSDFFHVKADPWRRAAWETIKHTPHLTWLVLTKRPELIKARLPHDWGEGYPNVWLGVTVGWKGGLNKMDTLRRIPAAVRWVSAEPLLEDIAADINLDGFHWLVCGGESGAGDEYLWEPAPHWQTYKRDQGSGRRTMRPEWAVNLRDKVKAAGLPFMFKQVTAPKSGYGYNALDGKDWHEFPAAPNGLTWAPRQAIPAKYAMTPPEWKAFMGGEKE